MLPVNLKIFSQVYWPWFPFKTNKNSVKRTREISEIITKLNFQLVFVYALWSLRLHFE